MTGPPLWGRGGGPIAPRLLCLHWLTATPDPGTVGYDPRAFSDEAELQRVVAKVAEVGSYGAVWWGGEMRLGVEAGRKAGHAGGSAGLADANANSFGAAIPYLSPSYRPRGIAGEQELPFTVTATGEQRTAWYPPLDWPMLVQVVTECRAFFLEQGWQPSGVVTHDMINQRKNDIAQLNGAKSPTGAAMHGELTRLFLGLPAARVA